MAKRRTDDFTATNVEYAIYLEETRGAAAGLKFAWSMKLPSEVMDRIMNGRLARRTGCDRRSGAREE